MSRPVFLYLFERQSEVVRKAASPRNVTAMSQVWQASSISHSEPEMSGEAERDAVKVKLAISDAFANAYIKDRPEGQVNLTIYRFERDDNTYQYEWSGRL